MTMYPAPLARLIQGLSKLPGIGEKSAARLAFHMLKGNKEDVFRLSESIGRLRQEMGLCQRCFGFSEVHALLVGAGEQVVDTTEEARKRLDDAAAQARVQAEKLAQDARVRAEELQHRGKVVLEEQKGRVSAALDATRKPAAKAEPPAPEAPAE